MATPNKDAVDTLVAHLHNESTYQTDLDTVLRYRTVSVGRGLEAAATEAGEHTLFIAEDALELVSAAYYPDNALTAATATKATLTLGKADGAGGAVTDFDSFHTAVAGDGGTDDWVQGVPEAWTIDSTTDTLAAGEALMFVETKTAAGTVLPCGTIIVHYRFL